MALPNWDERNLGFRVLGVGWGSGGPALKSGSVHTWVPSTHTPGMRLLAQLSQVLPAIRVLL